MEGYGDLAHADPVTAHRHTPYAHPYNTARNSGCGHIEAISGRLWIATCRGQSPSERRDQLRWERNHSHVCAPDPRGGNTMELSITAAIARIPGNAARQARSAVRERAGTRPALPAHPLIM